LTACSSRATAANVVSAETPLVSLSRRRRCTGSTPARCSSRALSRASRASRKLITTRGDCASA
jgi:hypothetical protein